MKIVGTLVNNKLEAMKNQLICISKLENDNVCISTGGTKHTGIKNIEYYKVNLK